MSEEFDPNATQRVQLPSVLNCRGFQGDAALTRLNSARPVWLMASLPTYHHTVARTTTLELENVPGSNTKKSKIPHNRSDSRARMRDNLLAGGA